MSELNPNYPVMEMAISLVDHAPLESGHERVLAGDIIAVRYPDIGIGLKEAKAFLWIRVEGLEEHELRLLDRSIKGFDKRRYCIPLEKIKEIRPSFDVDLAMDENIIYQPFLTIDYETDYCFILEEPPFQISGLVYDKLTGEYL